jgi:transcriptional regulator with XRE-family HTH domain
MHHPSPKGAGRRKAARLLSQSRRWAGLGQTKLARASGVPLRTLTRIEAGEVVPRVDTLERLLLACGQTLVIEARAPTFDREEPGTPPPEWNRGLRYLSAVGVRHVVVGQLAALFHGAPEDAQRIEILIPASADQRRRVLNAAERLNKPLIRVALEVHETEAERFARIERAAHYVPSISGLVAATT